MANRLYLTPESLEELIEDEISPTQAASLIRTLRTLLPANSYPTELTNGAYVRFVHLIKMALYPEESFDMPQVMPALVCASCGVPLDDEDECMNMDCVASDLHEPNPDDEPDLDIEDDEDDEDNEIDWDDEPDNGVDDDDYDERDDKDVITLPEAPIRG